MEQAKKIVLLDSEQVWYEGNKTAYSPRNMVPGCQYEAKVHAWLHNKEAWEYPKNQQWGPSSKSIQFVVPILQPLDTQESKWRKKMKVGYNIVALYFESFSA